VPASQAQQDRMLHPESKETFLIPMKD